MKIKTGVLNLLVLFLFVNASAQLHHDIQYGFTINIPPNWSQKSYMDGTDKVYDFYSPDENAAVQLRAFESMPGLTLDLLVQVYEQNMLPAGTQKQGLQNHTSANGIPGKQGVYLMNYEGNEVGMSSFYTIQNGKGYVLTAIIPVNMMQQKEAEIKQITRSFSIDGFTPPSVHQDKKPKGLGGLTGGLDGKKNSMPFKINKIQLCEQINAQNLPIAVTNKFHPQSPEIIAAMQYSGKTKEDFFVSWIFIPQNRTILRDAFNFTADGGVGVVSISKPNNGWPVGNYKVVFEMGGKIIQSIPFTVQAQENNQGGGNNNAFAGRYNFISRTDGQRLVRYHYIDIHSDGTYTEKYEPKDSPGYEGGNSGTWKLNGNKLTLTHQGGGVTDTYEVQGNQLLRHTAGGLTFKFRKNTQ